MAAVRFLNMLIIAFSYGIVKINIFKVLFWEGWRGGGSQKEYSSCVRF